MVRERSRVPVTTMASDWLEVTASAAAVWAMAGAPVNASAIQLTVIMFFIEIPATCRRATVPPKFGRTSCER